MKTVVLHSLLKAFPQGTTLFRALHSAHGGCHCPCPAKPELPHAPAYTPRAPFQLGLGPPVPSIFLHISHSSAPAWPQSLLVQPLWWLTPAGEAPTTSELEPPGHHVTPRAGRGLPTNPLLPQHWSLVWKPQSCIATCSSSHVKRNTKLFPQLTQQQQQD